MNARPNAFGTSGGPLTQVLSVLVFGVLLVGAVVMGAVILAVVLGLAVVAYVAFVVRVWWLRRKMGRGAPPRAASDPDRHDGGRLIDAEYTVLDERDPGRDRGAAGDDRGSRGEPR
jgi:hypothetical protein